MDQFNNQDLERNSADRERARAQLAQKIETLENRMRDNISQVKETVRRSTDVRYQVDKHPWAMLALSVGVGLVAGKLLGASSRPTFRRRTRSQVEDLLRHGSDATRSTFEALAENINMDRYANQFGVLKKAALAALAPLAGEFMRQVAPALLAQVDKFASKSSDEHVERARQTGERVSEGVERVNDRVRSSVH